MMRPLLREGPLKKNEVFAINKFFDFIFILYLFIYIVILLMDFMVSFLIACTRKDTL